MVDDIAALLRRFSSLGIMSQAVCYSRIATEPVFYQTRNLQSLFVVFLTSRANLDNFRETTSYDDRSHHTWLVIFAKAIDERAIRLCRSPQGNPFNLVFNSRMIVKCHDDDLVRKWYALFENRTEVIRLARWRRNLGFINMNKKYFDRRFDLLGMTMKIATVSLVCYGKFDSK